MIIFFLLLTNCNNEASENATENDSIENFSNEKDEKIVEHHEIETIYTSMNLSEPKLVLSLGLTDKETSKPSNLCALQNVS